MGNQYTGDPEPTNLLSTRIERRELLKRTAMLGIGATAFAGLLAACGDEDDDDTPAADTTDDSDDSDDEPVDDSDDDEDDDDTDTDAGEPGGEIVVGLTIDITTPDPHMVSDLVTNGVLVNIFEGLVIREPDSSEVVPQLAESYELVDDTTWEFTIREGVQFHNGEELTAETVKYSLERSLNPDFGSPQRFFVAVIDEIEAVDDYTIRINTDGPVPSLPTRLSTAPAQIVPMEYIEENGDEHFANNPVGTGPFRFVEWVRDERFVLEANDDHWDGAPNLDRVSFRPISETSARIAALQTGDIDIAANIPPDQAEALEGSDDFSIQGVPSVLIVYLGIDTLSEDVPTNDVRVRQALNYANDQDTIVNDILRGYGRVTASPLSPEVFGFNDSLEPYPYDPDQARELLEEAGYDEGELSITIHAPSARYSMDRDIAQAVGGYFEAVGIDSEVQIHEWGEYVRINYGTDEPGSLYMLGFGGYGTFLPELIMPPIIGSDGFLSTTNDPELDELFENGETELDDDQRQAYWEEAQEVVYEQAYRVFLHQQFNIYGVRDRLVDFTPRGDEVVQFKDIASGTNASVR